LFGCAVASPGFVARRGKDGNYYGALTANIRAGCSSCPMTNSFVTNAERAVSLTSAPADLKDYTILG